MGVLKEWTCIVHGPFESSHAICPNFGCDSKGVSQEFRTPVRIGSQFRKAFDAGIRKSSDMMGGKNFRTARAGDTAYGGDAAKEAGTELLWGDAQVKKVMGRSFAELRSVAAKPLVINKRDGTQIRHERNNAMADAATTAGITQRRLPPIAELSREPIV
jgi:hypothetical protein